MNEHHPQYGWMIVVIIIVCIVAWIYSSNRSNTENYGKDSTHAEVTNNYYPLSAGFGGCMAIKPDGTPIMRGRNVKPITNTAK